MSSALSCVICHDCDQSLRFFHVPSNEQRLQRWCDLLKLDIKSSSIVCEKHFLKEHISRNWELNCYRLKKNAIPTLHLTDEYISKIKLINEEAFDNKDSIDHCDIVQRDCKSKSTQTQQLPNTITLFKMNCLWCTGNFVNPSFHDILQHIKSYHFDEIELYFEKTEDEIMNLKTYDEDDFYEPVTDEMEESCDFNDEDVDANIVNESSSIKSEQFEDNDNLENDEDDIEMNSAFNIEQLDVENELIVDVNSLEHDDDDDDEDNDGNIDNILKIQTDETENDATTKLLPPGETSNNEVDMSKSDASLIFYMIDLLQTIPTLWFFNGVMSTQYEAGFNQFCAQFSVKYPYFMSQVEVHGSLLAIRDWYTKMFRLRTFEQLTYPQNVYYQKLAEFMPDKPDGKTCELCGVLFNDHLQYFAHQKLQHGMHEDSNEPTPLEYLRINSFVYFYARYLPRQGGYSYQCQICPMKRRAKSEFLEHLKQHLDIRDHVCDVCGKSFIKQENFIVHKNRHLGLHKFQCKICLKEFTNMSLLTAHRKRYHRPIEGTIEEIEIFCKKRQTTNDGMVHHGPTSFNTFYADDDSIIYGCLYCDKTYKHRSGIFKHRRISHPEVVAAKAKAAKLAKKTTIDE